MRKSKLITVLILVVILVIGLSSVLIACDLTEKNDSNGSGGGSTKPIPLPPTGGNEPGDDGPVIYYSQQDFLMKIVNAIEIPDSVLDGSEALSIDLEMEATSMKNEKTVIAIKGNFFYADKVADGEKDGSEVDADGEDRVIRNEFVITVKKPDVDGVLFGLYMVDDKMYLDLGEGKDILFLEDFNPNYVFDILKGGVGELAKLLQDLDLSSISNYIPIILGVLFEQPVATLRSDGGQDISMRIKLDTLLADVKELLEQMIQLPVDLSPLLSFLDSLIPKVTYRLNTSFDSSGKMTYLAAEMDDTVNSEKGNLDIDLQIKDQMVDTGMPEIDEARIKNFSFTNIQFSIDLLVGTQTELVNDNGVIKEVPKRIDVGKLVNSLLGGMGVLPTGFKLPEELLMLEGGTGIRLAFALDLDLNYKKEDVDNNKIAIELYLLNKDGTIAEKDGDGNPIPQIGIYYTAGSLYLNLDNMLPNYMKGVNLRVDTNISSLISALVDMITDAIDKALGTDFDSAIHPGVKRQKDGSLAFSSSEALDSILQSTNAGVLSLSKDEESGDFVINVGFKTFIEAVAIVLGLPENLVVNGNTISIIVNNDMFDAINNLAGKDLGIKLPDVITKAQLNINLYDKGLESVAVQATLDSVLDLELRVHQFLIGFEDPTLDERIENGIDAENTSYINSLGGAIETVLGGVMFSAHLNLNFSKNKYNLAPLIASFGLPQLANTDIIWEFDDAFKLDASLNVQISLDRSRPSNSMIVFEIKAEEDGIAIGGRKIFEKGTVILGLYGYNNSIYIDLSNFNIVNIKLPKLKFDLRFTDLVYSLVDGMVAQLLEGMGIEGGDLVFDFDLSELLGLGGAPTQPASSAGAMATADSEGEDTPAPVDPEIAAIVLGVSTECITPYVTMASVMALLKTLNVELGADISEVLGLMDIEIGMEMGRKNGFKFTISGDVVPILDESYGEGKDGISVLYFDANNAQLPTHDELGKRIVYESGHYAYKKYIYGDKMNLLMELGNDNYPVKIGELPADKKFDIVEKSKEFDTYTSDLIQAIMDTVGTGQIKLSLDLITHDNDMDLTKLINNVLANMGKRLEIPINLNLDDWKTNVELVLEWNIDLNSSARSAIKLELRYGADEGISGKTILGVYIYRNALIIDLEGLGFFRAKLVNSDIIDKLFGVLAGYVDQIDDLDLTKIITDLLENANLPTLPGAGTEGGDNSDIATDGDLPTIGEGLEVMDLIEYILKAVSLENTAIMLDFPSTLINTLLKELLGINLGIDLSLGGQLDVFGESFKLDIGVEDLEVHAKLDFEVGQDINIEVDYERIPTWDATSGSILAKTMLDNLDLGLVLDFANYTADTEQVTNDDGKVFTRIIIEKVKQGGKYLVNSADNNFIEEGKIVVTVAHISEENYKNNEKGTYTPIVYVVLDYEATSNQMKIFLCKNVVNFIIDFSTVINDMGFSLDLLGSLGKVFDDLFKSLDGMFEGLGSGTNSETQELATADGEGSEETSGFDEVLANLDITQLLSAGINVSLRSNGNFNADIAFDPYTINKLIDDILSLIFSGGTGKKSLLDLSSMASNMFSEDHFGRVVWTRMKRGTKDDKSSFWGSLRDEVPKILSSVLNSLSPGLGGASGLIPESVYNQVRNILSGLIPFAVFNEFHVGVNVVDSTLANIYIHGDDNYQEIKAPGASAEEKPAYGLDTSARNENYFTHITLYNMFSAVGKPSTSIDGNTTGVVTWADIPSQLTFAPYTYETVDKGKDEIIKKHFTDKVADYQNGNMVGNTASATVGAIIKAPVSFKIVAEADSNGNTVPCSPKDISALNLENPGIYKIEARAQFTSTIYRTMTVTIESLGDGDGIKSIDPIEMHAYDYNGDRDKANFPDFITANMGDGTSRLINTDYLEFIDAAPTQYDKTHTIDAKVRFPRIGQADMPIKITYLDSSISEIIVNGTAIGGNDKYPRLVINLYDYNLEESSIEDYISDVFYFKYKDGRAVGIDINREWDVSAAESFFNRERDEDGYSRDVSGEAFSVSTSIGEGVLEQQVELVIWIKTKNVTKLTINGLENTVKIDPYMYYMYLITGDESYNPFPSTAMANYHDVYPGVKEDTIIDDNNGVAEEVNIAWNKEEYENVEFDYMSDQSTDIPVNVRLDNSKYKGSFTWEFPTKMVVLRNQIQAIYFDPKDTPADELSQTTLFIDPFKYRLNLAAGNGDANFPSEAYILFTNGSVRYMPIRWIGLDKFDVTDYDNKFQQLQIEIGFNVEGKLTAAQEKNFKQSAFVNVKVENLEPLGLDIAGSEYSKENNGQKVFYIDPIQVLYYGMSAFPSEVTMVYNGGRTSVLPITWDFNLDDITLKGKKGLQATAEIEKGYNYTIDVEIIDRSSLESTLKAVEIDPYKYETDENGSRIYKNFASSAQLRQLLGNVDIEIVTDEEGKQTVKVNTDCVKHATAGKSEEKEYATRIEYEVSYRTVGSQTVETKAFRDIDELEDFVLSSSNAVIVGAVAYEYFSVPVVWDLTEINYAVADVYTVKMISKSMSGVADKTFKVDVTVKAKKVKYVGGENYYVPINVGGSNLTAEEMMTKTTVRNLSVKFEDESSGTYECTIDLSEVDFDRYTVTLESGGVYKDRSGKILSNDAAVAGAGQSVTATVCSGDIAQKVTVKVVVIYTISTFA